MASRLWRRCDGFERTGCVESHFLGVDRNLCLVSRVGWSHWDWYDRGEDGFHAVFLTLRSRGTHSLVVFNEAVCVLQVFGVELLILAGSAVSPVHAVLRALSILILAVVKNALDGLGLR